MLRHRAPILLALAALGAAAALGSSADAQNVREPPPGQRSKPEAGQVPTGDEDRAFATAATQGHFLVMQSATTALKRSREAEVRRLAQTVLSDHKLASDLLASLAGPAGTALPARSDDATRARLDQLEGASGEAFDRIFAEVQIGAQQELIAVYSREVDSGRNPEIAKMAAETLPRLQAGLEGAQQLQASLAQAASR